MKEDSLGLDSLIRRMMNLGNILRKKLDSFRLKRFLP
jgi:hypothetical protein